MLKRAFVLWERRYLFLQREDSVSRYWIESLLWLQHNGFIQRNARMRFEPQALFAQVHSSASEVQCTSHKSPTVVASGDVPEAMMQVGRQLAVHDVKSALCVPFLI